MPVTAAGQLQVWVDQSLCTGDGLCAQLAPEVFELDVDGIAYVRGPDGDLLTAEGARGPVPEDVAGEVVDSARDCPGACIFVSAADGTPVAGPHVSG